MTKTTTGAGDLAQRRGDALRIIDYWYLMESLEQDDAPSSGKVDDPSSSREAKGEPRYQDRLVRLELAGIDGPLAEAFRARAKRPPGWVAASGDGLHSALAVYVGEVERDVVLRHMTEKMGLEPGESRQEKSGARVALASFLLDEEGSYQEGTLEVSPLLVEMRALTQGTDVPRPAAAPGRLAAKGGDARLRKLEAPLAGGPSDDRRPAVDGRRLRGFREAVDAYFGPGLLRELGAELDVVAVKGRLYKDEQAAAHRVDRSWSRLCSAFFQSDLQLAGEWLGRLPDGELDKLEPLVSYASALCGEARGGRLDVLDPDPDARPEVLGFYSDVLRVEREPWGKWPSQHPASLMQQVAVNLAAGPDAPEKRPYEFVPGRVMSVNGPPGTGKTTLLKDVVAAAVVEKARILSAYEVPDDAFVERRFDKGPEKDRGYIDDACHFFELADDRINDYGIIVCSSNNAAVENLSAELPRTDKLLGGLTSSDKGVPEVRALFDPDSDPRPAIRWKVGHGEARDYCSPYLSRPARLLFGKDHGQEEEGVWGLVSTPLGKWENINSFSWRALYCLVEKIRFTKKDEALKLYDEARDAFVRQLKTVEDLRNDRMELQGRFRAAGRRAIDLEDDIAQLEDELASLCRRAEEAKEDLRLQQRRLFDLIDGFRREEGLVAMSVPAKDDHRAILSFIQRHQSDVGQRLRELDKRERELQLAFEDANRQYEAAKGKEQQLEDERRQRREALTNSEGNASAAERAYDRARQDYDDAGRWGKKRRKKAMVTARSSFDAACAERDAARLAFDIARDELKAGEEKAERLRGAADRARRELEADEGSRRRDEQGRFAAHRGALEAALTELHAAADRFDEFDDECNWLIHLLTGSREELDATREEMGRLRRAAEGGAFDIVDEAFLDRLLGGDAEEKSRAHATTPRHAGAQTDEAYDREREKLFYCALRLTEAFVLASRRCGDNLRNLYGMWQGSDCVKKNTEYRPVDADREKAMPALLQTLLLVVPVVSTAFASVGRMFEFVKRPGVFGLLVVDEAGQAVPQAAVGALFRCRRALMVGDPNQVEPVVTDELAVLRQGRHELAPSPYLRKDVSAQQLADAQNPFGSRLGRDGEWYGCPLLMHRRCDSPMFDISNAVSYNGMMQRPIDKLRPPTPEQVERERGRYCRDRSQWIQVVGREKGRGDHFVEAQAEAALEIVRRAFERAEPGNVPSLYVISPFKTVAEGFKQFASKRIGCRSDHWDRFRKENIGTVHTFQGKEADEVVFLLGCDKSKGASGAVRWASQNPNIVNVAVSRAKHRLYVIGDGEAWKCGESGGGAPSAVATMKRILDRQWVEAYEKSLECRDGDLGDAYLALARSLAPEPALDVVAPRAGDDVGPEGPTALEIAGVDASYFANTRGLALDDELLRSYGFESREDFDQAFSCDVRPADRGAMGLDAVKDCVRQGMVLGRMLDLDGPAAATGGLWCSSSCVVMFGIAVESYFAQCYLPSLRRMAPDHRMSKTETLRDYKRIVTCGNYVTILEKATQPAELGLLTAPKDPELDAAWWGEFRANLRAFTGIRNDAAHASTALQKGDDGRYPNPLPELKRRLFRVDGNRCGLLVEKEAARLLDEESRNAERPQADAAEAPAPQPCRCPPPPFVQDGDQAREGVSISKLIDRWGDEDPNDRRWRLVMEANKGSVAYDEKPDGTGRHKRRALFVRLCEAGYIEIDANGAWRPTAEGEERGFYAEVRDGRPYLLCDLGREQEIRDVLYRAARAARSAQA